MKEKLLACLLALVMILGILPVVGVAAEVEDQVHDAGGSWLYTANGEEPVSGDKLGDNNSVVKVSKTIEQYSKNGELVENEFVVTLHVQTSQDLKQIASKTPDSAVLLVMDVSNSMDDCIHCGKEATDKEHGSSETFYYCNGNSGSEFKSFYNSQYCENCWNQSRVFRTRSQHNEVTITSSGCGYQSRLAATRAAAKDFLSEFANQTGAQEGDKRMVAIVAYGSHAVRALDWVDITTTQGMYAAERAIDGLTVANGNHKSERQGGGTNIEGGLALGRNLLQLEAVSKIDYRYTILLTDGQPTYPADDPDDDDVEFIEGVTNNVYNPGDSTQKADFDDVADIADEILKKSKLYSVCFGKVGNEKVWDLKPFGDNRTVGDWLNSFSKAYEAEDASSAELFDTFSSILAQIQVAAKAWKVEDWMGEHMVFIEEVDDGGINNHVTLNPSADDYPDGIAPAFVWDLLTSEADESDWNYTTNTGVLGYTLRYRVQLDNLDTTYSLRNAPTPANSKATLRYATTDEKGNWPESTDEYKTANFPVPEVKGLVGTLTFTKMVRGNEGTEERPLEGITFRLRSNAVDNPTNADQWDYVDAVSDENGTVTFENIPSGHSYTLLEAEQNDEYVDLGDIPVDVRWGTAYVDTEKTFVKKDNALLLYNTLDENNLGMLTIQKSFTPNSEKPHSIQFLIESEDNKYSAHRSLYASDAIEGDDNTWSWTLKGLRFGEYTIQEINALDAHGNLLRGTHDLSYQIYVDGNEKKTGTFDEDDDSTHPKVTVNLDSEDSDKTVEVKFINNMTKKQGTLNISKSFEGLDNLDLADSLTMEVIATPVDANGAAIPGETIHTMTLAKSSSGYSASMKLPIGNYKLSEKITGAVNGYSLLHYAFIQGEQYIENSIITIKGDENETLDLILHNHYEQDKGRIHIVKTFDGDLDKDNFVDRVIYINVYENNKEGKVAAQIQLDDGDGTWIVATPELPLGTYYLEEVVDENASGTAFTSGYALTPEWTPGNVVQLTTKGQNVSIGLKNTYEHDKGQIKVVKTFEGDLTAEYFEQNNKEITISIYNAGDTDKTNPVDTLTLPNTEGKWEAMSTTLPIGDYELVESGAEVDNYNLTQNWTNIKVGTTSTVSVADDATTVVSLTNRYVQHIGNLTVSKRFAGLPTELVDGMQVDITITNTVTNDVRTVELPKQPTAPDEDVWTDTVELPVGVYKLEETVSDAEGYSLSKAEWTGLADGNTITIANGDAAVVSVENTYTDNYGYLTINKVLNGLESLDTKFQFQIMDQSGKATIETVEVGSNGRGSKIIKLPIGQYKVTEMLPSASADSRYKITYTSESTGVYIGTDGIVTVNVLSGEQKEFTCTNTNLGKVTVKIPVEKTVKVTGNTVPEKTTFTFGVETNSISGLPLDVDFINAEPAANGKLEGNAAGGYTITVDGEGTVKGYIVITGFADDLDDCELRTWEKLTPYASVQDAKNAHWIFDQTAQNSELRWSVTLKKTGDSSVSYDISLGQNGGKDKITFENTYDKVEVPELPETGDHDEPLLYLLLIMMSIGGIVLLRKKYAR